MDRIMRAVVPRPMQLAIRNAPPESSMRPAMFFRPMDGLPFFSDSETALPVRKPPPLSVMRMMQLSPSHCVTMRMRPPSPRERYDAVVVVERIAEEVCETHDHIARHARPFDTGDI